MIRARLDPSLRARVVRSVPLLYADGADASLDRPAHVRSASGLTRVEGCIVAVQDDASFVAVIDPATGLARAIPLPAGEGGLRQFDDVRGNKRFKLDLESCVTLVDEDEREMLLAFGSGSLPAREKMVLVRGLDTHDPRVEVIDATALYGALPSTFRGSELNIEGATVLGATLRLFNRGNGAPRGGIAPVNASCKVDLTTLFGDDPFIYNVVQYDLGTIGGLPLTFTDAEMFGGGAILYAAAAEDSPDATRDGPVVGSAIGIIEENSARYCEVEGNPGKIEGILPLSSTRLLAVVDPDEPHTPSTLLEIELS